MSDKKQKPYLEILPNKEPDRLSQSLDRSSAKPGEKLQAQPAVKDISTPNASLESMLDPRSRRIHTRVKRPLEIRIQDKKYNAIDWSVGGISVGEFYLDFKKGDQIAAEISFPFEHFNFNLNVTCSIAWNNPAVGQVGLKFSDLHQGQIDMLQYLVNCYLTGKLALVDGLLSSTNMEAFGPNAGQGAQYFAPANKTVVSPAKRISNWIIYSSGMVALMIAIGSQLYRNFYFINSTEAQVTAEMIRLKSPVKGSLKWAQSTPKKRVNQGDLIAILEDLNLQGQFKLAQADLAKEESRLENLQQLLKARKFRSRTTTQVASSELYKSLTEDKTRVMASLHIAKKQLSTAAVLNASGALSEEELGATREKLIKIERDLQRIDLSLKESGTREIDSIPPTQATAESAAFIAAESLVRELELQNKTVTLAHTRVSTLATQMEGFIIRSPCKCEIDKIILKPGESVLPGGNVANLYYQEGRELNVSALVSPTDANQLREGQEAAIRFTTLNSQAKGKILSLRAITPQELERDYAIKPLTSVADSFFLVSLKLETELANLEPGTPAEVSFPLQRWPFTGRTRR